MTEKSPRQPRKPFQNAGKREKTPGQDKRRGGRSEGRMEKPYRSKPSEDRGAKPYPRKERSFDKPEGDRPPKRAFKKERPYRDEDRGDRPPKRAFKKERPYRDEDRGDRPPKRAFKKERPYRDEDRGDRPPKRAFKKERPYRDEDRGDRPSKRDFKKERPYGDDRRAERPVKRIIRKESAEGQDGPVKKYATRSGMRIQPSVHEPEGIRLNRYIANSGICSRREADQLIQAGVIMVNGVVVSTLGTKVMPGDKVQYGDQTLSDERKRYLLLNKQKGYVTTTKDPHAKNTVMELIEGACKERIYPVGRLDRNTTGLLLFTNDGELAKKLMHPRSRVNKLYHVVVDQPVSKADMAKIASGVELEGEVIEVDGIEYVEDASDRREIGMEIHSGQNRVIRRIFESLGYKVTKLDRVIYAGLTKKNLPRGKWRFLSEQEVINLKKLR